MARGRLLYFQHEISLFAHIYSGISESIMAGLGVRVKVWPSWRPHESKNKPNIKLHFVFVRKCWNFLIKMNNSFANNCVIYPFTNRPFLLNAAQQFNIPGAFIMQFSNSSVLFEFGFNNTNIVFRMNKTLRSTMWLPIEVIFAVMLNIRNVYFILHGFVVKLSGSICVRYNQKRGWIGFNKPMHKHIVENGVGCFNMSVDFDGVCFPRQLIFFATKSIFKVFT